MSKGALNFNEEAVDYYTPKKIIEYFRKTLYDFYYDPATTPERPVSQSDLECLPPEVLE